jgi:integrase
MVSLGPWPDVSIADARAKAAEAREHRRAGKNPVEEQRAAREKAHMESVRTFEQVALLFLAKDDSLAPRTVRKHQWILSLLKPIHARPIASIDAPQVLRVLESIAASGRREAAKRCGQFVGRVFRHAINRGWYDKVNPAPNLRGELKPVIVESHAGLTDPKLFWLLMKLFDLAGFGYPTTCNGLRLLARTATRAGELRQAQWSEINFDKAEWIIPAERMKMRRPHLVPLSRQALAILREQQKISGAGSLIFPGARSGRPMSDATMNQALKVFIGADQHVPHGFRVSFSTILNGHGHDPAIVELCLSHAKRDAVAAIYDRSQRNPERRKLMQAWADLIDELKA